MFLPTQLEVITFEVKPAEAVSIMGVLEAIAHREAAHRAYVLYAMSSARFEAAVEYERIAELAQKYGVGIVVTERPDEVENWEIVIEAIRHEPDPARLDRFLGEFAKRSNEKTAYEMERLVYRAVLFKNINRNGSLFQMPFLHPKRRRIGSLQQGGNMEQQTDKYAALLKRRKPKEIICARSESSLHRRMFHSPMLFWN